MQMLHTLVVFGESWSDFVHLHPSFSLGLVSRPWGAWIATFGKIAFIPWSTAKSPYLGLFPLQSVQVQCLCWAPVSKRAETTQAMQSSLFSTGAQPGAGDCPRVLLMPCCPSAWTDGTAGFQAAGGSAVAPCNAQSNKHPNRRRVAFKGKKGKLKKAQVAT